MKIVLKKKKILRKRDAFPFSVSSWVPAVSGTVLTNGQVLPSLGIWPKTTETFLKIGDSAISSSQSSGSQLGMYHLLMDTLETCRGVFVFVLFFLLKYG